jgi:hypothetical protein
MRVPGKCPSCGSAQLRRIGGYSNRKWLPGQPSVRTCIRFCCDHCGSVSPFTCAIRRRSGPGAGGRTFVVEIEVPTLVTRRRWKLPRRYGVSYSVIEPETAQSWAGEDGPIGTFDSYLKAKSAAKEWLDR